MGQVSWQEEADVSTVPHEGESHMRTHGDDTMSSEAAVSAALSVWADRAMLLVG